MAFRIFQLAFGQSSCQILLTLEIELCRWRREMFWSWWHLSAWYWQCAFKSLPQRWGKHSTVSLRQILWLLFWRLDLCLPALFDEDEGKWAHWFQTLGCFLKHSSFCSSSQHNCCGASKSRGRLQAQHARMQLMLLIFDLNLRHKDKRNDETHSNLRLLLEIFPGAH